MEELTSASSSTSSSSSSSTQSEKRRISIHQVDLASKEEIAGLFEEIKKEHKGENVDILISNAGYGKRIVDISWVILSSVAVPTPLPNALIVIVMWTFLMHALGIFHWKNSSIH